MSDQEAEPAGLSRVDVCKPLDLFVMIDRKGSRL
jgi:hypothetical protein